MRSQGAIVDVHHIQRRRPAPIDWSQYDAACLAASVHAGHHEKEMTAFIKTHRAALERLGAVFVTVSLSEAGAEDPNASQERRDRSAGDVARMTDTFIRETGWRPARILPVAGSLSYSRYNFLVRFLMKRIARHAGAPTDTSRDYEFTNWAAVDRFVDELVHGVNEQRREAVG
jgi:menaquinone-dependent protoporphyrinogen oxidase